MLGYPKEGGTTRIRKNRPRLHFMVPPPNKVGPSLCQKDSSPSYSIETLMKNNERRSKKREPEERKLHKLEKNRSCLHLKAPPPNKVTPAFAHEDSSPSCCIESFMKNNDRSKKKKSQKKESYTN